MEPDVFPRRNLGEGEHWGRTLETRTDRMGTRAETLAELLGGNSRNAAAQLTELQRQAEALRGELLSVPIALQGSGFGSNFAVPATWVTPAAVHFTVPAGKTRARIIARGSTNIDWVAAPGPGGSERFHWPFSLGTVTQEYGPNSAYFDGMHKGMDFGIAGGTSIIAPGSGTVTLKTYDGERGNYVIIDHGDGLTTRYYHLQSPSPLSVGDSVTKGVTNIGPVGNTGFSDGNHLHWETRVDGNHMNPRNFMDLYANSGGGAAIPFDFLARIVIGGTSLREFRGSREPIRGDTRIYAASGRTFNVTPGSTVSVFFQLRSTNGLTNPAYGDTFGALMAFGVFT